MASPPFTLVPIGSSPGRKLYQAHSRLRHQLTSQFEKAGYAITTESWAMLSQLWEHDGLTQAELGQRLEKDRPFTSRLVDALEEQGYVQRRASRDDRRSRVIALTPKGRSARRPLTRIATSCLEDVFDGVSARDLRTFVRILDRIIDLGPPGRHPRASAQRP